MSYIELTADNFHSEVIEEKDVGSHMMFICEVTADVVLNSNEAITYAYYQNKIVHLSA